jgi:O-glycosyl hydrolase
VAPRSNAHSRRYAASATLAAVVVLLGACKATDPGVPDGIAGGYGGGGIGGLTGNSCYVNPNSAPPLDGASVVTLDATTTFQTMQGFGASIRLFDDPRTTNTLDPVTKRATAASVPSETQQSVILDALYTDLALTRVRFLPAEGGGIEPVNDNADPLASDLAKFDFSWTKSDGQLDLTAELSRRGVRTWFAAAPTLEKWMTEANPEEYAEWVMVMLRHWRDRGYEMPYYSLKNEPGSTTSGVVSGAYLRDVAKILGPRMQAEGLKTKLVLPDDDAAQSYARLLVILGDADARKYVGAVAVHLRPGGSISSEIRQLASQYGIPVWVTDASAPDDYLDFAKTTHEAITAGASAVDYTWAFMGDFDKSQLVRLVESDGAFQRTNLPQHYYVMGQYSKFVRPGAVRIAATSNDPLVLATAYVDGFKLIVVVTYLGVSQGINAERPVRVEMKTGAPCVKRVDVFRTGSSDFWYAVPPIFITDPRFSLSVPARTVVTFIGQQ